MEVYTKPRTILFVKTGKCDLEVDFTDTEQSDYFAEAAKIYESKGHDVCVVANSYKPSRQKMSQRIIQVEVGHWIPRSIFGHCKNSMYVFRTIYTSIRAGMIGRQINPSLVLVDANFISLPVLYKFGLKNIVCFSQYRKLILQDHSTQIGYVNPITRAIFKTCVSYAKEMVLPSMTASRKFAYYFGTKPMTFSLYPPLDCEMLAEDRFLLANFSTFDNQHDEDAIYWYLTVGPMDESSNFMLIINALGSVIRTYESIGKHIHLNIVGYIDIHSKKQVGYLKHLKNEIKSLYYHDQIKLHLNVTLEEKYKFYRSCQAVINARTEADFNWSILEAQFFGRPVITVQNDFAAEVIRDGINGYFSKGDSTAIGELIYRCLNVLNIPYPVIVHSFGSYNINFAYVFFEKEIIHLLSRYAPTLRLRPRLV